MELYSVTAEQFDQQRKVSQEQTAQVHEQLKKADPDFDPDSLPATGWSEIVGERKLLQAQFADFGLGDMSVGLLQFADETYEVGVGECLRPYRQLYLGTDLEQASEKFVLYVASFFDEDEE